ncbi:MAG: PolC-type DNA polymerase III [Clostridia bacterium]|nr:PolC-type DNA polymerase III [Clostridia bacterium]
MKKPFLEYFVKYKPEITEWAILQKMKDYSVRAERESRAIELTVDLEDAVKEEALISLGAAIKSAYDLNFVSVIVRYPPESFSERSVRDVIRMAELTGFLLRGFFDEPEITVSRAEDADAREVAVRLPYTEKAVSLVRALNAEEALSAALSERFGSLFSVSILADEALASRKGKEAETALLARLGALSCEEQAAYDASRAAPPPAGEEGDPAPRLKRYSTVYAAAAAPLFLEKKKKRAAAAAEVSASPGLSFLTEGGDGEDAPAPEPEETEEKTSAPAGETPREAETPAASAFVYRGESRSVRLDGSQLFARFRTYDLSAPELIYGETFSFTDPLPIAALEGRTQNVCFAGEAFWTERREPRKGKKFDSITVGVTDSEASVYLKFTVPTGEETPLTEIVPGTPVAVTGFCSKDDYTGEYFVKPRAVAKIGRIGRKDTAEKKRVELHLHTQMSQMDALIEPKKLVKTLQSWGHTAVAVTDHGTVQAYPDLMIASEKAGGPKILYGMEAYFVDDTESAAHGDADAVLDGEFVVFDTETTGLSPITCALTEIGAVLISGGEVVDRFSTYVDPEMPIPAEITALTGISDETVKGAPKAPEALERFFAFAGDRILVAHNANFDISFLRAVCDRERRKFPYTYLDTLALSRYLNPELKRHSQERLAEYYGLGRYEAHRAHEDAEMLSKIFLKMIEKVSKEGVRDVEGLKRAMADKTDPARLRTYHMTLLAENQAGLKNLYKLISKSYLDYFYRKPKIPKSVLEQYREGLLVGSACEEGEVYRAVFGGRDAEEIDRIVSFYDYLEIMPLSNNAFLVEEGKLPDEEALREINRRICAAGERCGKPVCATGDAHFLEPDDEIYRKLLLASMEYEDCDRDTGLYLKTTDEMLAEFSYLGEEKAYEVVVENTNRIADRIEAIRPIPKGTYTPSMEGAEEELKKMCWDRAASMYGHEGEIPEIVSTRLERELSSIIRHGFAVLYIIAQRLVSYSESLGYLVGSRGSVGSSFVATMAGISEVNPLPPHYYCPKCRWSEFYTDGSVGSGFDLPDRTCPVCGAPLRGDGHDIPFETFLGFKGDKSPDIDLNFSGDVQGKVHKYTETLFGAENVFRAGTIGTLAEKTAYGYAKKYAEFKRVELTEAENQRLVCGCVGVKKTTGQHPGGIVVVPKEYEIYDFTPVQHPADDPTSSIVTTHFQFSYLHDTILKLDELGHDIPSKYKKLEEYTGTSVLDVPMNDPKVYELFLSSEPLGISPKAMDNCSLGTLGLPEMGTRLVISVLEEAKPKNFADLLQVSGLTHGTGVWNGNAQDLIREGTCTISDVIGTRDGIMLYLIRYGLDNSSAFKIMETVRKNKAGAPIPDEMVENMRSHGVPEWYIDSCRKIRYMFPKAHAAAYVISALRLAWYKIYYPREFYAAFFTVAPGGFDSAIVLGGMSAINAYIREVDEKSKKGSKEKASQKEKDLQGTLYLVREAILRGIRFLPVDLYRSDASAFLVEEEGIRLPFSTMSGLGERAAQMIVEARADGEFLSREELRIRANLNKSVVEVLAAAGVLDTLTETNQLSFF